MFFIAKEWKFVMNKVLFTRFANNLRNLIPNIAFEELALKIINEVIDLLEEENEI
jgi:hypothetical protein